MRNGSRIGQLIARILIVLLAAGGWTPVVAAAAQGPSSADLEAFRARLVELLQSLPQDPSTAASVADGVARIESLPAADLQVLYSVYPKDGPFWQAARKLTAFRNTDAGKQLATRAAQAAANAGPRAAGLAAADTTGPTCDGDWSFGSERYEALWVERDVLNAAQIAMDLIPEDALTSPAFVPAAILWGALKAAGFVTEQTYQRWQDCIALNYAATTDATLNSRATQSSVDAIKATIDGLSGSLADLGEKLGALGPVELSANVVELKDALNAATPKISRPSGAARIFDPTGQQYVDFPVDDPDTRDNQFASGGPNDFVSVSGSAVHVPQGTIVTLYRNGDYNGGATDDVSLTIDATAAGTPASGIDRTDLLAVFNNHGPRSIKVTQSVVTNPDLLASQKSIDSLTAKVDGLSLAGTGTIATKVDSLTTTVNGVQTGMSGITPKIDASVSSRATQASVNQVQNGVSSIQNTVGLIQGSSSAAQTGVTLLQTGMGTLQTTADQLRADVAGVRTSIGGIDLSKLDAAISTRATQTGLDAVGAAVQLNADRLATDIAGVKTAVQAVDLSKLDAPVTTRAQESTLVALAANTAAGLQTIQNKVNALDTGKLDAAMSTRASQASLDAALAAVLGAVRGQSALSLQIVEIQKRKRYLVYVTVAGAPAAGATLARFQALELSDNKPAVATDATAGAVITEVAPGILDVALNLPGGKTDAVAVTVTLTASGVTTTGSSILQTK